MKNIILYLMILLLPAHLLAQDLPAAKEVPGFSSVSEAGRVAEQIVEASGLPANFAILEAEVPNAVAVLRQGKRYILYNPRFMNAITRITGTEWAAVSVLAHEIGHHLYGKQTGNGIPKLATELEADEFSGFVLEKMGATLSEAQAAMSMTPASRESLTHPAKADRMSSIAKGWKDAGGMEQVADPNSATVSAKARAESSTAGTMITATVHFNANPGGQYYVTKEMKLVSVDESGESTIGQVTQSDSETYPYIIYDDAGYRLYVHYSGAIISRSGRVLGRVELRS
ncbi:MAG TPA: hypothetical protein VGO58_19145 [Chitinophagaceae bacterium]|jgi:hypothetical protein|nr:hypothetical protein [Chitinophagaceae bacterium]